MDARTIPKRVEADSSPKISGCDEKLFKHVQWFPARRIPDHGIDGASPGVLGARIVRTQCPRVAQGNDDPVLAYALAIQILFVPHCVYHVHSQEIHPVRMAVFRSLKVPDTFPFDHLLPFHRLSIDSISMDSWVNTWVALSCPSVALLANCQHSCL